MQAGTSELSPGTAEPKTLVNGSHLDKDSALAALQHRLLKSLAQGIDMDGLHYHNADLDVDIRLGKEALHTCEYRLRMTDTYLGEISFTRDRRFTEQELQLIEAFIPGLVEQLKNSLEPGS